MVVGVVDRYRGVEEGEHEVDRRVIVIIREETEAHGGDADT